MFDFQTHITPYLEGIEYVANDTGYIVWRRGTGLNTELLHLKAYHPGQGHGTQLLRGMLERLKNNPPYSDVYGFSRVGNHSATLFYRKAGFVISKVDGVYADGAAYLFSRNYKRLLEVHNV